MRRHLLPFTFWFGWCCYITVLPGAALNIQVDWLLHIFSSGRSTFWLVSLNSLAQPSTSSPVHLPRLQTDWQTESWTDRHELCHHGYHSCCRLPPICSWRWGAAFTCHSVRGGGGVQGWLQVNACHFDGLFLQLTMLLTCSVLIQDFDICQILTDYSKVS